MIEIIDKIIKIIEILFKQLLLNINNKLIT